MKSVNVLAQTLKPTNVAELRKHLAKRYGSKLDGLTKHLEARPLETIVAEVTEKGRERFNEK